jgi:hypothetical protein
MSHCTTNLDGEIRQHYIIFEVVDITQKALSEKIKALLDSEE